MVHVLRAHKARNKQPKTQMSALTRFFWEKQNQPKHITYTVFVQNQTENEREKKKMNTKRERESEKEELIHCLLPCT